jgi:hypothetical protein
VLGVEAIAAAIRDSGRSASPFGIDWWLWSESHREEHNRKPYHLTRTIWY